MNSELIAQIKAKRMSENGGLNPLDMKIIAEVEELEREKAELSERLLYKEVSHIQADERIEELENENATLREIVEDSGIDADEMIALKQGEL